LLGTVGIASFFVGLIGLVYLTTYWCFAQLHPDWHLTPLHERPLVIYSMGALLLGVQLMSMGFLAELFTSYYGRDADVFSIRERTWCTAASDNNFANGNGGSNGAKESRPPTNVASRPS
jgi:hypothetical protein